MLDTTIDQLETFPDIEEMSIEELLADIQSVCERASVLGSVEELSTAALEGLGNLIKRVVVGLVNLIPKIFNNITSSFAGLVTTKRSALQESIDANVIYYRKVKNTKFSAIYNSKIPVFLFKKKPIDVSKYFNVQFHQFDAVAKVNRLIDTYNLISANVRLGANDELKGLISRVNDINATKDTKLSVKELKKMVITRPSSNLTTLGKVFKSTDDMIISVDSTLQSKSSITDTLDVVKLTGKLEKSWDRLIASLKKVDDSIDVKLLNTLANTIQDTGEFLRSYGGISQEYHRLELFLAQCVESTSTTVERL